MDSIQQLLSELVDKVTAEHHQTVSKKLQAEVKYLKLTLKRSEEQVANLNQARNILNAKVSELMGQLAKLNDTLAASRFEIEAKQFKIGESNLIVK